MTQSTLLPRGQVAIPPEVHEYIKELYTLKGEVTAFAKRANIGLDTLRLAMVRGTTTEKTLQRIKTAMQRSSFPVLANATGATGNGVALGNGHLEPSMGQLGQLPPAVLRQVQRVSSALLDGMQLMQLTVLKVIQEELAERQRPV